MDQHQHVRFSFQLKRLIFFVRFVSLMHMAASSMTPLARNGEKFSFGNFRQSPHGFAFQKSGTSIYSRVLQCEMECLADCLSKKGCHSVNVAFQGENRVQCELLNYGDSNFDQYLVRRDTFRNFRLKTACYPNPCQNGGLCSPNETGERYSCFCSENFRGTNCQHGCVIFNFEQGLTGWTRTGTAFNNQPTYGDNPTARGLLRQPSNHEGNWWIGTYENRPSPSHTAGAIQLDTPTGTLTSPPFVIRGAKLTFLIGGGCDINIERAELVIGGALVAQSTGSCNEPMIRNHWDVSSYRGRTAQLRLVDSGSSGWKHINFDDLVDGFCQESK